MAINIYENNISNLLIGESSVTSVYVGSDLVYSSTPIPNYLQFTAVSGDATIGMSGTATPNVSYSFDGTNWTTWDYSDITIPSGSTVYVKGNNSNGFSTSSATTKIFTTSGTVEANGNIMSLLYGDNFEEQLTIPSSYCFYYLFRNCTITTSPQLPATTMKSWCYAGMFEGCTGITTPPTLPATTTIEHCYRSMFNGCSNLTSAPELPATRLTERCYYGMFAGCTSLTSSPQLPATTLATTCYANMFRGCTSLRTAPTLPAKTLVSQCYNDMFTNCSNLNYIKAMFTTTPSTSYTSNWVQGVASSGTYVKNSSASYTTRGTSAIPTGWTIQTASS